MGVSRAPKLPSEIHLSGAFAAIPAASADNAGLAYYADEGGIYLSDGTAWTAYGSDPTEARGQATGVMRPRHHNLVAWNTPHTAVNAGLAPTAGVGMFSRIETPVDITFSKVVVNMTVVAVTPANCIFAVYDRSKALIGKSADFSASLLATVGEKEIPLVGAPFTKTGGTVESGGTDEFVWAWLLIGSAGTMPQFGRFLAVANQLNLGLTVTTQARNGTSGAALTDAPATLGTIASGGTNMYWFGLRA